MRRIALIIGVLVLTGALVAGISAATMKTINGTPKNDVLTGTPRSDTLNGRAGNDKLLGKAGNDILIGGAGNDLLVGGPGQDKLGCGPGRDTAIADSTDTVGSDCETVKGLPSTAPPPAPAPPPVPPPPPAPSVKAGHYCGFTNQGKSICFDSTGTSVASFATTSDVDSVSASSTTSISRSEARRRSSPISASRSSTKGLWGQAAGRRSPTSRRATP
jgi:RTX calcium-binding nonapeptide repeat (4 copies)